MKKSVFLSMIFVVFMLLLTICRGQNNKKSVTNETQLYFPFEEVFKDTSRYVEREPFHNSWYSNHLHAMKEPVIYTNNSLNEIYRFTWLRSFHHPVAIRIEKQDNKYMLYWKVCNGAGGYDPGELVINKQKALDEKTWVEFVKALEQVDFWNLQTSERVYRRTIIFDNGERAVETQISVDGARWILEGRIHPQYHVVDRHSPQKESKFYQCCDFLIQLTDLEISDRDKY